MVGHTMMGWYYGNTYQVGNASLGGAWAAPAGSGTRWACGTTLLSFRVRWVWGVGAAKFSAASWRSAQQDPLVNPQPVFSMKMWWCTSLNHSDTRFHRWLVKFPGLSSPKKQSGHFSKWKWTQTDFCRCVWQGGRLSPVSFGDLFEYKYCSVDLCLRKCVV